jgi:hypothetical protein
MTPRHNALWMASILLASSTLLPVYASGIYTEASSMQASSTQAFAGGLRVISAGLARDTFIGLVEPGSSSYAKIRYYTTQDCTSSSYGPWDTPNTLVPIQFQAGKVYYVNGGVIYSTYAGNPQITTMHSVSFVPQNSQEENTFPDPSSDTAYCFRNITCASGACTATSPSIINVYLVVG